MNDLLVANVRYLRGADDRPLAGWLRVEGGVIVDGGVGGAPAAGGAASFDGGDLLLAPGYIDVHVHAHRGDQVPDRVRRVECCSRPLRRDRPLARAHGFTMPRSTRRRK